MKVLKFFLIILLLFQTGKTIAQIKFQNGYYINSNQDTIHGYIKKWIDKRKFESFSFKSDLTLKPQMVYPETVSMLKVDGELFESHIFNEKDSTQLSAFFKIIIAGKLTLLKYNNRYFVRTLTNELHEITRKTERIMVEKKYKFDTHDILKIDKVDYSGLGILLYLMQDCELITRSYLEPKYNSDHYKKIILKYNQCVGSSSD